ncbi:ABC transporter substrate-binding protein [Sorangium cellulosum]|uniref:ABC transporter substrate-binding protein n=1 Tax=Sorangium cellulosum TaxID=56 RepID=A0A150SWZ5_SORCE|nr:ABC transporter substrate-binding protein [Sorangium cellulosum]KYF96974.1 ABC transporter substrate-binding protein [Sorangium cellulosum]
MAPSRPVRPGLLRAASPVIFLLVLLALCGAAGCSRDGASRGSAAGPEGEFETLELRYQGNNGTVSPIELAEDLGYLAPIRLNFIGSTVSGPQSVQAVVTGDTDFGGAFNGAIIKLIAAKAPIIAVAGYYGVDEQRQSGFYVLNDSPLRAARDLLDKSISMNTLGAHSEFMVKEFLSRNQITLEEARRITLLVVPPVNGEQLLREKQVDVASLGDIYRDRALERGGVRALFSDYELCGKFTAGSYVMKTSFIKENPKTARRFVEATAKAIEWARSTPRETVVERFIALMKKRGRNEEDAAIRFWRSYGVAGKGGSIAERDFQIWLDWMVKSGELKPGEIALSRLYTNEFNPYANEQAVK